MTKTTLALFLVFSGLLFTTAQGASHVCYLKSCAVITPKNEIFDNNKEYVYPDHRRFSEASLREQYRAPIAFLDLKSQTLRQKVSSDFMLGEFVQSEKGRYGIILPKTVQSAQSIRDALNSPVKITSGYRSPGYNARVDGSATWSRHMYGDAVDMQHRSLKNLEKECIRQKASFVLVYKAHIHCDWRKVDLDPDFYPPAKTPDVSPTFAVLRQRLSAQISIVNDGRRLMVTLPEELEIEGELVYRWRITTPQNQLLYFDTPLIEISEAHPQGLYKIDLVVGETLRTTTSLQL